MFDDVILLSLTNKDTASLWRLEDEFLVHTASNKVLTAHSDGSMYLTNKAAGLRSIDSGYDTVVLDRGLGIIEKLLALHDYLKVSTNYLPLILISSFKKHNNLTPYAQDMKYEAQQWKLTTVAPVTCPELGPELQSLDRGETFSHLRADTECLDSVEPVMTAFSNEYSEGGCIIVLHHYHLINCNQLDTL